MSGKAKTRGAPRLPCDDLALERVHLERQDPACWQLTAQMLDGNLLRINFVATPDGYLDVFQQVDGGELTALRGADAPGAADR